MTTAQQNPIAKPLIRTIPARELRAGHHLFDHRCAAHALRVLRVVTLSDGSIRIHTGNAEQRVTGSVPVRICQVQ